ncbi:hypothetical protein Droror1_Dr00001439 [Drosera rotundifolia]
MKLKSIPRIKAAAILSISFHLHSSCPHKKTINIKEDSPRQDLAATKLIIFEDSKEDPHTSKGGNQNINIQPQDKNAYSRLMEIHTHIMSQSKVKHPAKEKQNHTQRDYKRGATTRTRDSQPGKSKHRENGLQPR